MKIIKTTIIALIIMSTNFFSQNFKLPLWENHIPNQNNIKVEELIDTSDLIRIKEVDKPIIEVYLPSKKNISGEAVVIFPGGGYSILAYVWEGTDIAKWLNANGICAIVVKYRLPHSANNIEGRLSPFLDAQRALRLTRFHAKEWNIDPNKIGIIGFSAGGHLASTLGTHFNDNFFITDKIDSISCRPDFMILMYPVITFKEPSLHTGSRHFLIGDSADSSLVNYYSNELHVTKDTPPTFLVHAGDDKAVPVENSIMFYNKLKENGVSAEMHIFREGGHGFGLALGKGRLAQWKDLCISWIKDIVK
jgi:acetyl esterase/lipase